MRAGRFDRQIFVDLPDLNERKAIFEVHVKPLTLAKDVDIDFLSKQTPGFSGADIANVCNESALIAARKNKKIVEKQDFLDAVDRIIGGLEKKNKIIYLKYRLKNKINSLISKIWGKDIKQFQSLSFFPSDISNKINNSEYDIIHLTWINEFLSIEDIGRIKKPIVWTLCDMWPIAGISHYEKDDEDSFWKFKNFLKYNFGKFDIDKWIMPNS